MHSASLYQQIRNMTEQRFFRGLNSLVEPLVRRGALSFSITPASLVVLETIGFRSGLQRRTPLWSLRLGRYRLVGTSRGSRSFWIKNLQKTPQTSYFVGGKKASAEAIMMTPDFDNLDQWELSPILARLLAALSTYARRGWGFALLVPSSELSS